MILYNMTLEEKNIIIHNIYLELLKKAYSFRKPYWEALKSRKGSVVFKTTKTFYYNNNKYVAIFNSSTGSLKDFGVSMFLILNDDKGFQHYYQIMVGGFLREFTHHAIERFIERSNCDKNNFLPYLVKECLNVTFHPSGGKIHFQNTANGIFVCKNFTVITYINDLSQYKQNEKDKVLDIVKNTKYSRKDSIRAVLDPRVIIIK